MTKDAQIKQQGFRLLIAQAAVLRATHTKDYDALEAAAVTFCCEAAQVFGELSSLAREQQPASQPLQTQKGRRRAR